MLACRDGVPALQAGGALRPQVRQPAVRPSRPEQASCQDRGSGAVQEEGCNLCEREYAGHPALDGARAVPLHATRRRPGEALWHVHMLHLVVKSYQWRVGSLVMPQHIPSGADASAPLCKPCGSHFAWHPLHALACTGMQSLVAGVVIVRVMNHVDEVTVP